VRRFFGPGYPNLAGYYRTNSGGRLVLSPARESQGTANDGVVIVNAGASGPFLSPPDIPANMDDPLGFARRSRLSLQLADPFVDFASFDVNPSDGTISTNELLVLNVVVGSGTCTAARGVEAVTLDGRQLASDFLTTPLWTDVNLITAIHEAGHILFGMRDLYGFGVGSFDLAGPTCGGPDSTQFSANAYQRLHLGWITPTVVTRDGYYDLRDYLASGSAYLLYDPDRGTSDYFLVENRRALAGTYDRSVADSGLVIWRVDDRQYSSGSEMLRPVEIMRPDGTRPNGCVETAPVCYRGADTDAWDPSDRRTPQREMARTWRDGTSARVAVRAIGPAGNVVRAYFDVRGPGILVDCYQPPGRLFPIEPGVSNTIGIPVMNTGEAADTFVVAAGGLPAGWTSSPVRRTLGAAGRSVAAVQITPDADADGVQRISVVGRSVSNGSVSSSCQVDVSLARRPTALRYTGRIEAFVGGRAGFRACLLELGAGVSEDVPAAGVEITFWLSTGKRSFVATARTDADGIASVNPVLPFPEGTYKLTVTSARAHGLAAARTGTLYEINPLVEPVFVAAPEFLPPVVAPPPQPVPKACANGRDDDGDGAVDYPKDSGCADSGDDDEADPPSPPSALPECSDGIDNDDDSAVDYPKDEACTSPEDNSEKI
jgi:M6 family metalloprotease-like protein